MKRFVINRRLAVTILTVIVFVLSCPLFVEKRWADGMCVESLTSPSENDHPYHISTVYGWPLKFLIVTTEGCFDERVTRTDWYFVGLFVDVVILVAVGGALYWLLSLYRRFRGGRGGSDRETMDASLLSR